MYIWKVRYEWGDDEWGMGRGYYLTNTKDLEKLERLIEGKCKSSKIEVRILSAEFLGECVVLK